MSAAFDEVIFDSGSVFDCSPELDPFDVEFRGIRLTAPERVSLVIEPAEDDEDEPRISRDTRFAVCLGMQFEAERVLRHSEPESQITLVCVDARDARAYLSLLASARSRKPLPPPALDPEDIARRISRFYYSVNACDYLELPPEPATYHVYATFEEFRSNTLTVVVEQ